MIEVAEIFRKFGGEYRKSHRFPMRMHKAMNAIENCRTAVLGGHIDECESCGHIKVSYNSCRNRHCPKCQGHKRVEWIQRREADLLPCTYYHVVFTLPQELNTLALYRPVLLYDALFSAVWHTLRLFAQKRGLQMGMIAVLHTWGQNLCLHPHLHCILPGGGIDGNGKWERCLHSDKYLFPVKALSNSCWLKQRVGELMYLPYKNVVDLKATGIISISTKQQTGAKPVCLLYTISR